MDGQFVDDLARGLAHGASRRGLLLGSLGLLARRTDEVAAKQKRCSPCKKRQKGKCRANLPDSTPCRTGTCQRGRCVAAAAPPQAPPQTPPPAACQDHHQCASSLCEVTSGTCVAQCSAVGEVCGDGCLCLSIGGGSAGLACLQIPDDRICAGFPPCTWDFDTTDPADMLSCPDRPGEICDVTGTCDGPEEVCLLLCPPSRRG
jgi:hypothetical protein